MHPSTTTWVLGSLAVVMNTFNIVLNGIVATSLRGTLPTIRALAFATISIDLIAMTSTAFFVVVRSQIMSRAPVFWQGGAYRQLAATSIATNSVAHTLSLILLVWIAIRIEDLSSRVAYPSIRILIVVWFAILCVAVISQLALYSHVMLSATRTPVFQIVSPDTHSGRFGLFGISPGCPEMGKAGSGPAANEASLVPSTATHPTHSLRVPTHQSRFLGGSLTENCSAEVVMTASELQDMQANKPAERPRQKEDQDFSKRYSLHDPLRMAWNTESSSPNTENSEGSSYTDEGSVFDISEERSSYTSEEDVSDVSEERIAYAVKIRKTYEHQRLCSRAPSPPSSIDCGGDTMAEHQPKSMIGPTDMLSTIQSPRSTLWGTAAVTSFSTSTFRHTVPTAPSSPVYHKFQHSFFRLESPLRGTVKSVKRSRRQTSTLTAISPQATRLSSRRNTKHHSLPPDAVATLQSDTTDDALAKHKILSGLEFSHLFGPFNVPQEQNEDGTNTIDGSQSSTKTLDLEPLRRVQDVFGAQAKLLRMLAGQENALKGFQ